MSAAGFKCFLEDAWCDWEKEGGTYSHRILYSISIAAEWRVEAHGVYKPFNMTAIRFPCCSFRM